MGNVLVLCELKDGKVKSTSLHAITCARQIAEKAGAEVDGLCIGASLGDGPKDAAKYVNKVYTVENGELENYMAETYAPAVAKAMEEADADYLVGTADNLAKDLFPRVTALIDGGMASDIVEVIDAKKYKRPTNAGNAIATMGVLTDKVVVTVRQTDFDAAQPAESAADVVSVDPGALDKLGAEFVELQLSESERPDLGEAKVVVAGGRGMKSKENFKKIEELADILGAAVGATRSAVDAGMV
jgi:electron transfer flavoprotein alpha subunit